jgi:hypothetical protein
VATVLLAIGLLTDTNANPRGGSPGAAGRSVTPTASPSADDTFPNAAETALLARLDPAIARLCDRAAKSAAPPIQSYYSGGFEPLPVQAGLRCALGASAPDFIFLWAVAPKIQNQGTVDKYFFQRVSAVRASAGDCATDKKAYMNWSFGLFSGKVICLAGATGARLDWIFEGEDVIARAERDDADRAALYQWWLDVGRVLLH